MKINHNEYVPGDIDSYHKRYNDLVETKGGIMDAKTLAKIDWMWVLDGVLDRLSVYGLVIGAMYGFSNWGPTGITVTLLMYSFTRPVCIPNSVQNFLELAWNFLLLLIWLAFVLVFSYFVPLPEGSSIALGLVLGLEIFA